MTQEKAEQLTHKIKTEYRNIAGLVLQKNGNVVYENYFNNCTAESKLHVYSVSKSIISALIGIAIDKGYIESVNQKVLHFFPDYRIKRKEGTIEEITIRDLLTMTAPYKYKFAPYTIIKYFMNDNWLNFTLDLLGGKDEIGTFRYTPLVGMDVLSGILMEATGQSVLDFAREVLFNPLGITVDRHIVFQTIKEQQAFNKSTNISGWVADKTGTNSGGWGLTLSAKDMVKIGQLYLDGGKWEERQLISEKWIEESTIEHSRWDKMNLSFGYLWWIIDENEKSFAGLGDGGNVIYINQKKEIVVSITALLDSKIDIKKERIGLIKEYIEPLVYNTL